MVTPGNDSKPRRKSGSIKRILISISLIAATFSIIAYAYLDSRGISPDMVNIRQIMAGSLFKRQDTQESGNMEFQYESREHPVFAAYKDNIVKCTKESVIGLNKKGEEQWKIPMSLSNPMVKAVGEYLLIADAGGRDVHVISGHAEKWKASMDNSIINADISDDGYVSIVQESKGYKAAVKVLDPYGAVIFTRNIETTFVVGAKVSPSASQVLINRLDASGVKSNAVLEFTDIYGNPYSSITRENELISSFWYLNDGSVLAAGSTALFCIDKDRKEKWRQDFKGRKLYSAGVLSGKLAVAAIEGETRIGGILKAGSVVSILGSNGQAVATYNVDGEVKNIETYGDLIAINTGREIHVINSKCKPLYRDAIKSDVLSVGFLNRHELMVVTRGSIIVLDIE